MEPLIDVKASRTECTSLSSAPIWQDILAQAMTGELVAAIFLAAAVRLRRYREPI